jgi:hypothetical protein
MASIKLLTWFNETNAFKINSSNEAVNAFEKEIMRVSYFSNSKESLEKLIK